MRKIHPGFTALAILLGPASIIIGHQKITGYLQPDVANPSDTAALVQQAYAHCSEVPQLRRAAWCDEYMGYFEQCVALDERCDPRPVYKVLVRLNLSSELPEMTTINKVAVTEGE
jgi:hypothetical protein